MIKKTLIGVLLISLLAIPGAREARADVDGWEAAGLVLAGAVGYAIINDLADDHHEVREYRGVPVYERSPRVRVYHTRPRKEWVPGHFEIRTEKVWIEGYYEKVWVPPVTRKVWVRTRRGGGYWEEEVVEPGHYRKVWREGYWDYVEQKVWVEGYWEYR